MIVLSIALTCKIFNENYNINTLLTLITLWVWLIFMQDALYIKYILEVL